MWKGRKQMETNPIGELMKSTMENVRNILKVDTVVGDPIFTPDGITLDPTYPASQNGAAATATVSNGKVTVTLKAEEYFETSEDRTCEPTEFAIGQGVDTDVNNGCCWWLLRSPGDGSHCAASVNSFGPIYNGGYYVYDDFLGIRPVIWIEP